MSWAVLRHRIYQDALGHLVHLRGQLVDLHHGNTNARPFYMAGGDQFPHHLHGLVDGDGITDALGVDHVAVLVIARIQGLGGGDTDDLATHIQEGAAAGAGIDGRIGLNVAVYLALHIGLPGGGANDAKGSGIRQHLSRGIADGYGEIPHLHLGAAAQGQGGKALGLHIDHRHIQFGVRADHLAGGGRAIDELHFHLASALHHMGVCDDIALAGNDKPAAIGHRHILFQLFVIIVHIHSHHALAGALHNIRQWVWHGLQRRSDPIQCGHFPGGIGGGLCGFRLGRCLGLGLVRVLGPPFPLPFPVAEIPMDLRQGIHIAPSAQALGPQGHDSGEQAA